MFSAPAAPDYTGAAEKQGESSQQNIASQTWANRPDINTPWGSMNWTPGHAIDPSTGKPVTTWNMGVNLTPGQQHALDDQQQIQSNRSDLAMGLQGRAADSLSQPMDWGSLPAMGDAEGTRSRAIDATYGRMASRLNPQWDQRQEALKSSLANQGLTEGSQAFDTAMGNFGRDRNDAYTTAQESAEQSGAAAAQQMYQMGLGTRQQALSEMLSERSQPLNEMEAVLNGQQVGMPQFPGFQGAGSAQPTQYLGAAGQQGQYGMQAWQQQNAMLGDIMGGAGGMAAMLPFMFCDERLKENIVRHDFDVIPGVPFATWTWKHNGRAGSGVIAQDLERVAPHLVFEDPASGLKLIKLY